MIIEQIMRTSPATVQSTDALAVAAQAMIWTGGRHLPVVDGGHVVGVLSEHDILRLQAQRGHEGLTVREAMTSPAHTARPKQDVSTAAGRMATERIGCLPVVEDGKLVGLITRTDVLSAIERMSFPAHPQVASDENTPAANGAISVLTKFKKRAEQTYEKLIHGL